MRRRHLVLLLGLCLAPVSGCGSSDGTEVERTADELKSACEPADVVLGIDIARYQHPNGVGIDWLTVAANRRFVIIKATENTDYVNEYYADDAAQARAAGMIVGSYHYLRYSTSGAAQAQHFLNTLGGSVPSGDLPPMLDVENTKESATPAEATAIMKEWLDTVEVATGRKPMIYSGAWYWGPYMGTPSGFSEHPLVWAAYTTTACPQIPDDFPGLTIWQYLGGEGTTPGISAPCDQDKFYGTEAELMELATGGADYAGDSLGVSGQSYPIVADGAVTVAVGQTVSGWIKLKNVGQKSWQPGSVWLAPIPRDQASPFQSPSWESGSRISTVSTEVPPGEVAEFQLDLSGKVIGESILSLGWVAEGVTWFADSPKGGGPKDGYFAVKVNVVEAGADAGNPSTGGTGGTHPGQTSTTIADDSGCSFAGTRRSPWVSDVSWLLLAGLWFVRRRRESDQDSDT
jgi:GH25 family lysozyme M1 (1,4-beta-N-acetylmuramidase)